MRRAGSLAAMVGFVAQIIIDCELYMWAAFSSKMEVKERAGSMRCLVQCAGRNSLNGLLTARCSACVR